MKKCGSFDNIKIQRRLYETGIMERGTISISPDEIEKCRLLVIKLFKLADQVFPRDGIAYFLQGYPENLDLEFNEWENEIIFSLTNENTLVKRIRTMKHIKYSWEICASRYRLTNKIGRNIKSRYCTKIE